MNKLILGSIKHFVILFSITQLLPFLFNKGDFKDIGLKIFFLIVASITISIKSDKARHKDI